MRRRFFCYPALAYILISNNRNEDCTQTPQSGLLHYAERLVQRAYRYLD